MLQVLHRFGLVCFWASCLTAPAHAQYATAGNIGAVCKTAGEFEQGICDAYIAATTDTLILADVMGCQPDDYDLKAIRKAAVAEMAKPEMKGRTAMAAIFNAVNAVFPCRPMPPKR